jgi:hypothetical protein
MAGKKIPKQLALPDRCAAPMSVILDDVERSAGELY